MIKKTSAAGLRTNKYGTCRECTCGEKAWGGLNKRQVGTDGWLPLVCNDWQMCSSAMWPRADPGGSIAFPKTFERNFFHHDFEEFGKQHSRHTAIKPSISLSQQCCKGYFISLTTTCNEIDYELLLKSPP